MLFGLLVFGAIVGVVFAFVGIYNRLVAAAEKATGAWNELDALLRQRHDEIPKIIEMCEPHFGRRARIVRSPARGACSGVRGAPNAGCRQRSGVPRWRCAPQRRRSWRARLHYSDLDASPAFGLLRQRQATLDLELKDRRDRYNDSVREYNAAIGRVPGSIVALVGSFPPLRPLDFERAGS